MTVKWVTSRGHALVVVPRLSTRARVRLACFVEGCGGSFSLATQDGLASNWTDACPACQALGKKVARGGA